jgi:chorismate mutase
MKNIPPNTSMRELDAAVLRLKQLVLDLEPSERSKAIQKIVAQLMPERRKAVSAVAKFKKRVKPVKGRPDEIQQQLIAQLSKATARLFDLHGGDHRA